MNGKCLSEELKGYYERKGNKVIFKNGMTLNQLAWEMWERLGYEGIDPSVVSRVLSGERNFTHKQLEIFCNVLKLSLADRKKLNELLFFELADKCGWDKSFFEKGNEFIVVVDLVEDNLQKIQDLITGGFPNLAWDWIDKTVIRVREELCITNDEKKFKQTLKLLAALLIERRKIILETVAPQEIYSYTVSLARELAKLGKDLKDESLIKRARFGIGTALRVKGRYKEALNYLRGVQEFESCDLVDIICSLREAALSEAKLQEEKQYEKIENSLRKRASELPLDLKCLTEEGIARCEGILGRPKEASEALSKAWKFYEDLESRKAKYKLFRKIELIRTELELGVRFKSNRKGYLEKIGKEGLILASHLGYERQKDEISGYLEEFLN